MHQPRHRLSPHIPLPLTPPPPPSPPPRTLQAGSSASVPPSGSGGVPRRAADALTNLAHDNSGIKSRVRSEGGIPPLVELLEAADAKVSRAAASALRTLAFKVGRGGRGRGLFICLAPPPPLYLSDGRAQGA